MELAYDAVELLRTDGVALIDVVSQSDLSTSIPSCPGWTMGELARHQGGVWSFWGRVVAEGVTDVDTLRSWDDSPVPSDEMLLDWLAVAHNQIYAAFTNTPVDTEIWTWTGSNRDVMWARRRMAQETAVHRADAASAVGLPYEIPTSVAADGIDEFLEFFLGRRRAEDATDVGGTVHLHCTDTDDGDTAGGEWFIESVAERDVVFTREHRKGDAAIRGPAADLLLWLWRREVADSSVDIIGDADVAERFRTFADLS